ncbi:putative secreted RxLR effector protein [Phytophthora cinnamomi]|uniref:putative secreted RxLR effector protein n=1 Tax=Phytophthora cinnamomi TaxID=4785 RepID=UPI00355A9ED0|nr:putative secreted RxLR effector protein [Phytophthora cinnamomi]
MKTSSSIFAAMTLLALASLGATAVHVDKNPLSNHPDDEANHLVTSEPVADERTWVPFRALRSMDSPKQGPHDDDKHPHHHDSHHDPNQDDKAGTKHAPHRALGQAHVTPAPTYTTAKATPAPTKIGGNHARATPAPTKSNTPKATPASTTTKTTLHPNTTTPKVASPPAAKVPKEPVAPATKQGKTGVSLTSNVAQHKARNLGGGEAKQQIPLDNHKPNPKNGLQHP